MTDDDLRRLFEDTRRHFDVVAERPEKKIKLAAEGVSTANERIEQLEQRMERGFADTQAMIKFSHSDLDAGSVRGGDSAHAGRF